MSDVYRTRVDASQNMARYYRMTVQPTLFGEWSVVREWGRIGRGGQVRKVLYPTQNVASQAISTLVKHKTRRGYSTAAESS